MVYKAFWDDPYLTTLQTEVTSVIGDQLTLDATIFFAQSGGQESDRGSIGVYPVLNARTDGQEIIYTLPADHKLKTGQVVTVMIDWERRYKLMRLHFAAEIVLELAYKHMSRPEKIGAHISEDKARIDFAMDRNISRYFEKLTMEAHTIVAANHRIESAYSDKAAGRRYWKIPEFAQVPCGGTHLRRTGEVGLVTLKRKNIGKSKERIEVTVS